MSLRRDAPERFEPYPTLDYIYRAAAMTLRTVLLSIQALLAAAEPDDPQDGVVAKQVSVWVGFELR